MNLNYKNFGNFKIPRKGRTFCTKLVKDQKRKSERYGVPRNITQLVVSLSDVQLFRGIAELLSRGGYPLGDSFSVMGYKKIEAHEDDWRDLRLPKGDYVKPGFLHVVMSGCFVFKIGSKKHTVKAGDVFLMNPNVRHEVVSTKGLCISASFDVPLWLAYNTLSKSLPFARSLA